MAADGRVQRIEPDLGLGDAGHQIKRGRRVFLGRLVAGGEHGQHARQRADLHRLAVEGRRLEPGVLAVVLEVGVLRLRLALVGVQRLVVARAE
jgi:hypothetical protein